MPSPREWIGLTGAQTRPEESCQSGLHIAQKCVASDYWGENRDSIGSTGTRALGKYAASKNRLLGRARLACDGEAIAVVNVNKDGTGWQ